MLSLSHHRLWCLRHSRIEDRLNIGKLSHELGNLAALQLNLTSQTLVLVDHPCHIISYIGGFHFDSLPLCPYFDRSLLLCLFRILVGVWNIAKYFAFGGGSGMNSSEVLVEVFLPRKALAGVSLTVRMRAVELSSWSATIVKISSSSFCWK